MVFPAGELNISLLKISSPINASSPLQVTRIASIYLQTCFKAVQVWLRVPIAVMIASIDLSQKIFAIDMLTALKPRLSIVASMLCLEQKDTFSYT